MMRKFTICLAMCAACFVLSNCKDDEAVSPPKSSLTADKASGVVYDDVIKDEITFTITEVNAESVALLPYGLEHQSWGAVTVSGFTGGKATVTYQYTHVGVFKAVVVSNNHTADGKSVKNSYSNEVTITITSGHNEISDFSFAKVDKGQSASTKTTIDEATHTIDVDVPYGTDLTKLVASFTADAFTKVSVGSTEQTSGTTPNVYTGPVTYTVTAANGTTNTYTVNVHTTPINNTVTFKSFSAKNVAKESKALGAALATTGTDLIFYDVYNTPASGLDSIAFSYELTNPFGVAHNVVTAGAEKFKMKQGEVVLNPGKINVLGQDSVIQAYNVYTVDAPYLTFNSLTPSTVAVNTNFFVLVKALKTTVTDSQLFLTFDITSPSGVVVTGLTLTDDLHPAGANFVNGSSTTIDFTDGATIVLHVVDSNIGKSYDVTYTSGLTELQ